MTGTITRNVIATNSSSTSQEMEIPFGFILVAVSIPVEATSTTFTLADSEKSGGTFLTLKDPLGVYTTAGSAISFTIGSTSLGKFWIPPTVASALNSYMKVVLGSSETAAVTLTFRQIS